MLYTIKMTLQLTKYIQVNPEETKKLLSAHVLKPDF